MIIKTKDITVNNCNDCLFRKRGGHNEPDYCSHPESPKGYGGALNNKYIVPDWCVGKKGASGSWAEGEN